MTRRICSILVALAALAPPAAHASHESMPVWPPLFSTQPVTVTGTGPSGCGALTVTGVPATLSQDLRTGIVRGSVSATATTQCVSQVPLIVRLTAAVWLDRGQGPLDGNTILAADLIRLTLLSTNTCVLHAEDARAKSCETPEVDFELEPGSRYVVVAAAVYELPEGHAWLSIAPPGCRPTDVRRRAYCLVAADFRA